MNENKARNEDALRKAAPSLEENRAGRQHNGAQEQRRVLPKDPDTLNPSQKGPAQPSDNKTNPT